MACFFLLVYLPKKFSLYICLVQIFLLEWPGFIMNISTCQTTRTYLDQHTRVVVDNVVVLLFEQSFSFI